MGSVGETLRETLRRRGVSRRDFVKFCGATAAVLALPARYTPRIAQALEQARPIILWREFQDCAGNTESMLRSSHPDIASLVLEALSLDYHETLMAGAGRQAEAQIERVIREYKGKYIAVIEGAIPTADSGVYCTIGGRTAVDLAREVCTNAAATIALGACAWDGGFPAAGPTGAVGVERVVPGIKVVNLGGCPQNPANTAAVVVHYLTFGQLPALDRYGRPLFAYGDLIHNQCERRAYYDAGLFVEEWGDEGHRKGWCLYRMGCKGPATHYNCPNVRWNDGTSWPVQAGHGCIGCASYQFWLNMSPFYDRLPAVRPLGSDVDAGQIGVALTAGVGALTAVHAAGKAVQARSARPRRPRPGAERQEEPDA